MKKFWDKLNWALVAPVMAQGIDIKPKGSFGALGDLTIERVISGLVNLVLIGAALVFFFILVWGGIKWIASQGDETKVKEARDQVTQALIGLAIVFVAWAILTLISTVFGINIFNLEITPF